MNPPTLPEGQLSRKEDDSGLPAWLMWVFGGGDRHAPSGGEVGGTDGGNVGGGCTGGDGGGD